MSRCEICGSKADCDEFCGDSFSDMRESVLLSREVIEDLEVENEKLRKRLSFYVSEDFECSECGCLEIAIEEGIELCDMCSETMDVLKQLEGDK